MSPSRILPGRYMPRSLLFHQPNRAQDNSSNMAIVSRRVRQYELDADEIERRYDGRDAYLGLVREAAERLVEERYLLAEDVELCVHIAGERYDYAMSV